MHNLYKLSVHKAIKALGYLKVVSLIKDKQDNCLMLLIVTVMDLSLAFVLIHFEKEPFFTFFKLAGMSTS